MILKILATEDTERTEKNQRETIGVHYGYENIRNRMSQRLSLWPLCSLWLKECLCNEY